MGQLDAIRMIGDALTDIDMAAGRLGPNAPDTIALFAKRDQLDAQQRQLVKMIFNDNTAAFEAAGKHLAAVNEDLRASLEKIEHMATLLADVERFVHAATSLVSAAKVA